MMKKIIYCIFISCWLYANELITNIKISGNTKTKNYIILQEIKHPIGITFNSSIAKADQERIYSLDIFNFVQIGYIDSTYHILVQEKQNYSISPKIKKNTLDKGFGLKIKFHNINGNNNQIESGVTFGKIKYFFTKYTNSLINKKNHFISVLSEIEKHDNLIENYSKVYSNIALSYNLKNKKTMMSIFLNGQKNKLTYLTNESRSYSFINTGINLTAKKNNINLILSQYFSLNKIDNYSKISFKHQYIKKNKDNSSYLLINSQMQLISNNYSPVHEISYLGGDDLVRGYETNPELNHTEVQNKLKFKNFIFNSIQFEIPIFNSKKTQTNLFFFIDQAIGSKKNSDFNFSNKIKGYGFGYSIYTKKEIKFDLSVGLNQYGQRLFHFNVVSNPY